ncbi:MAG: non-ribosomal peptide synthetase, partial [Gemmatimonadetes bacterium]|nr:non-ribosomal peptide synthetase [Gemmatimonadota bacterium]
ILGRSDNQVKIRGYRVELGEVEAAIRAHDGVSSCLAVMREDVPGDRRLVAYVVGRAGAEELREHLRRSVPEYMVPSAFVALDALPQAATGKVDPRTLPAPEYGHAPGAGAEAEAQGPADEVEAQLTGVWEELLGIDGIAPTENFFELGGNSFVALRLLALVNKRMGTSLQVTTLFTGATVRQMAQAVAEQRMKARAAESALAPLKAEGSRPPLFCVHSSGRR